jgi:hypothetical protein
VTGQRQSRQSRESRARRERLDRIEAEVADGTLTIRHATDEQRKQWYPRRELRRQRARVAIAAMAEHDADDGELVADVDGEEP